MRLFSYIWKFFRRAPPPKPPERTWTLEEHRDFMNHCTEVYRRAECSRRTGHVVSCRCPACMRLYNMMVELDG
jgi:hypothetical protein